MYVADTIVAPATAPGTGAVAIVRLSGPRAFEILRLIFRPAHRGALAPRMLRLGDIIDPASGVSVDRALAVTMPLPASLTGEDVAELQCHGGPCIVRRIVALATAAGARLAERGEFTRWAFWNGRLDLAEAEAVADLVSARSESALSQALSQLSGALSERVEQMRREVIAIRAHLEVEIDFSDEDIRLPSRREVAAEIERLIATVALMHDSFRRGLLMRDGVRATIIGRTNVGKSSLLNLILGADRAIVTPIAADLRERGLELPILRFSAIDFEQAPTLREELTKIIDAMMHDASPSQIAISRERHRDALASALTALRNAHASALAPMPPEIVAVDIVAAADALGSITGEVTSEDVLDAIFRDFCICK